MSRHNDERLRDILEAVFAINEHLEHGSLDHGIVFDAVLYRLLQIGEAINATDPSLLAKEPHIDWRGPVATRNRLAHQYWDTAYAVVESIVVDDLPVLVEAVERLLAQLPSG